MEGFKAAEPEAVARAIVGTLTCPRFDVFVPRAVGWALGGMGILPRRAREHLAHTLRVDEALLNVDVTARTAYL